MAKTKEIELKAPLLKSQEVKGVRLYDIQQEHTALLEKLESLMERQVAGEEVSEEEINALTEELALSEDTFEAKAQNYFYAIKMLGIEEKAASETAKAIKAEADRYARVAKKKKGVASSLKQRLLDAMGQMGHKKFVFGDGSFMNRVVVENKSLDTSKMVYKPGVNDHYFTMVPMVNAEAVKRDLLDGIAVEGAQLNDSVSLRLSK